MDKGIFPALFHFFLLSFSQVLVLPPFQKQGHGAQLLQTFYNTCYGNSDILDITGKQLKNLLVKIYLPGPKVIKPFSCSTEPSMTCMAPRL